MGDAITDESIQGLGHLKKVFAAFEKLAPVGTERDTANNRTLLYSQYASLILLSMFNPAMQCVRGLSDASALKKVQRLIVGRRVSNGSLSESVRVFEPLNIPAWKSNRSLFLPTDARWLSRGATALFICGTSPLARNVLTFDQLGAAVNRVAFSHDGTIWAAALHNGSIRLWHDAPNDH